MQNNVMYKNQGWNSLISYVKLKRPLKVINSCTIKTIFSLKAREKFACPFNRI